MKEGVLSPSHQAVVRVFAAFSTATFLLACAAGGVPYTSDPERKLGWARELYVNRHRPIPAERLIKEAIEIYQERNDQLGLAKAYSMYGRFLQSPDYHTDTFFNKREDYPYWKDRATEYFQKSLIIFLNQHQYHDASNAVLNLGILKMKSDRVEACSFFDQSLKLHQEGIEKNPDQRFHLPSDVSSFVEGIGQLKKQAQCGETRER